MQPCARASATSVATDVFSRLPRPLPLDCPSPHPPTPHRIPLVTQKYGAEGMYVSLYDKVCESSRPLPLSLAPPPLLTRLARLLASCLL